MDMHLSTGGFKMNWISSLDKTEFESSASLTPQFSSFYRLFNREFKKLLNSYKVTKDNIKINRGHFEISGFFKTPDNKIWYFSLGDVRWFKDTMMIRSAKDFKDYTGGSNINLSLMTEGCFLQDLEKVILK